MLEIFAVILAVLSLCGTILSVLLARHLHNDSTRRHKKSMDQLEHMIINSEFGAEVAKRAFEYNKKHGEWPQITIGEDGKPHLHFYKSADISIGVQVRANREIG